MLNGFKLLYTTVILGRNEKIQIYEFYYGRLVPCCYGEDKRLGQILR